MSKAKNTKEMITAEEEIQNSIINLSAAAERGDKDILDVVILLRQKKDKLEEALGLIKAFENDNLETIEMDAKEYPNNEYKGFKFQITNGKKSFDFKHIPEWNKLILNLKGKEDEYKKTWALFQATKSRPITEDGEALPMPNVSFGKGYLTLKQIKRK